MTYSEIFPPGTRVVVQEGKVAESGTVVIVNGNKYAVALMENGRRYRLSIAKRTSFKFRHHG